MGFNPYKKNSITKCLAQQNSWPSPLTHSVIVICKVRTIYAFLLCRTLIRMISLRRLHKNSLTAERIYNATVRYFSIQSANPSPDATPSSSQYDELINAAAGKRDFAAVRDLFSERLIHGCFATNKTFNFIAKDVSVLDDLLQNLADLDDWFTRKHAHDALVAQLAKLCRTEEALRVAETMARKNYGATIATFNSILTALARKKEISASWRVVELMRACKVRPSVASFNYIITSSCFRGDVRSAADALVKMEEEGLKADVRTYDALVLGVCRAGKVEAALAVMRRMVEDGVPAIYSTYGHIIKEMVRGGYYAQAVEFVKIFAGRDEKLDAENFGYLIKRLKIRKRIEEAKLVVEEMVKRGLNVIYNNILFCFSSASIDIMNSLKGCSIEFITSLRHFHKMF